ncbi:uncharacterized protein LOC143895686 [Temnothorax americanus]|uniref:uncharacterized protein LOC143895686 n=1 Tax=Temnothorax americanus TaxID=1964332 RepID=UPI00406905E4
MPPIKSRRYKFMQPSQLTTALSFATAAATSGITIERKPALCPVTERNNDFRLSFYLKLLAMQTDNREVRSVCPRNLVQFWRAASGNGNRELEFRSQDRCARSCGYAGLSNHMD